MLKFMNYYLMKNRITPILILIPLLYLYLTLFRNALIDDTFITLSYVKSILHDGTWGMYSGYLTNTATSPLNVILLSAISVCTHSPIESVIILTLICFVAMLMFLSEISSKIFSNVVYGYVGATLIIFNPLLISTLGLETYLFITLFIASLYAYLIKRWTILSIFLALLTLTRADGFLIFSIYLIFIPTLKDKVKILLLFILFITPWYLFSWIHLGSFIPDTLMIKRWQKTWFGWSYWDGLFLYFKKSWLETLLSFSSLPIVFLLCAIPSKKKIPFLLLGFLGIGHFISYCILRVPPYHWYYATEIVSLILIATFIIGLIFEQKIRSSRMFKILVCILIVIPMIGMSYILLSKGLFLKEMPIHTNWATHEQYKTVGLWLKKNYPKSSIFLYGEVGTLAYYSDCYLWDAFGDRCIIESNIEKNIKEGGLRSLIYQFNFKFFSRHNKIPKYSYKLVAFNSSKNIAQMDGIKWDTSTKWFSNSLIVFDKY
jgi:hypothetical protein